MKNSKIGDSSDAIKQTRSLLSWRVRHLPYPRETAEYSYLGWKWKIVWKIKLPIPCIRKRWLEKQGPTVNYDLLCTQLESLLHTEEAEGYELVSMQSSHSGAYSVTTTQKQPHHQFVRKSLPSHQLQGHETLLLIFKHKESA